MSMRDRVQYAITSVVLVGLSIPLAFGQSTPVPTSLQITILEGEGALNDIRERTAHEPIVQVEDENHRPVAGALITFASPVGGPSGAFADGAHTLAVMTGEDGRARASGLRPNNQIGTYELKVFATFMGAKAEAVIRETNVRSNVSSNPSTRSAGHGFSPKWILIGGAVAGGVVAGVVATRGGGSALTITPGTGTVGAPALALAHLGRLYKH